MSAKAITGLLEVFTHADARHAGISDRDLYRMRDRGDIDRIARGIYAHPGFEADPDLVEIAIRAVDRQLLDQAEGRAFALACLQRHSGGDWGDLDVHDAEANDLALVTGARILSSYRIPERVRSGDGADGVRDERLWIITEAEDAEGARPQTTLLFPSDY